MDELFSCVGYPPLGGVKAAQDAFYAAWPRQVKSPQNRVKLLGPRGRLAIIVIIKRFIGVKFSERLGGIFRSQSGNGIGGVLLRQSASRNLRRFSQRMPAFAPRGKGAHFRQVLARAKWARGFALSGELAGEPLLQKA